jgi:hypothetical protein
VPQLTERHAPQLHQTTTLLPCERRPESHPNPHRSQQNDHLRWLRELTRPHGTACLKSACTLGVPNPPHHDRGKSLKPSLVVRRGSPPLPPLSLDSASACAARETWRTFRCVFLRSGVFSRSRTYMTSINLGTYCLRFELQRLDLPSTRRHRSFGKRVDAKRARHDHLSGRAHRRQLVQAGHTFHHSRSA